MSAALLTGLLATQLTAGLPTRAEPLDLVTALELAAKQDERPAIARAMAEEARAQHRLAWARLLPTLELSGTYRRRAFEVVREFDGDTATFQALNALAAQGTLSTTLFDARQIPNVQATDLTAEARQKQAEEQARRLAFETAEAFYAALAADRTLDAASRRLDLAAATSSNAQDRFSAGLVAKSQVNRTRLDFAEARQTRAEAARARRLARLALGFLIGVEPTGPLSVPTTPRPSPPDDAPLDRPDIVAARLLAEAAQRATWAPWLSLLPTLDLVAQLRATNETGFQGNTFNWDIALTLSWVLYDGGARYAEMDLTRARLEAARLEAAALERGADVEMARARADLEARLEILAQAEDRARLAEENRDEVAARFRRGLATALEGTDAATAAFEASVALEQARFAAAQAALAVRLAAGAWPTASSPDR